jgi:glycosyltransferase involved in cell wall biosynthesis
VTAAAAHLFDNPSLRLHMGAEAAARAREQFAWASVARATLDVYEALAAAPARRGALAVPADGWAVPA